MTDDAVAIQDRPLGGGMCGTGLRDCALAVCSEPTPTKAIPIQPKRVLSMAANLSFSNTSMIAFAFKSLGSDELAIGTLQAHQLVDLHMLSE